MATSLTTAAAATEAAADKLLNLESVLLGVVCGNIANQITSKDLSNASLMIKENAESAVLTALKKLPKGLIIKDEHDIMTKLEECKIYLSNSEITELLNNLRRTELLNNLRRR